MNPNEFQCSSCKQVFEKKRDGTWTEEQAVEEAEKLFPGMPEECRVIVCNDCWEKYHPTKNSEAYAAYLADRN